MNTEATTIEITDTPITDAGIIEVQQASIATLKAENVDLYAKLDSTRATLEDLRRAIAADADILSQELIGQAERRGWCEQYDEIITEINGKLSVISIAERQAPQEIEVTISGSFSFSRYVTVTAANEKQARDRFIECPGDYIDVHDVIAEEVRFGDAVDDYDIE